MTRPALASWAGESGSADPEAALEQAVCLFCASFSGVHNPAQHILFLLTAPPTQERCKRNLRNYVEPEPKECALTELDYALGQ